MSVKIKTVNGEQVLTIPNTIHPLAQEYQVYQGYDGTIVCLPDDNKKKLIESKD